MFIFCRVLTIAATCLSPHSVKKEDTAQTIPLRSIISQHDGFVTDNRHAAIHCGALEPQYLPKDTLVINIILSGFRQIATIALILLATIIINIVMSFINLFFLD